ncbi:MAG TPA: hypothetical protein DHW42_08310 [Candidatus Marinimicrobia bacterium]|nr:hypothetical protein [Candidatus Neomarinimicrobiota bacterium]
MKIRNRLDLTFIVLLAVLFLVTTIPLYTIAKNSLKKGISLHLISVAQSRADHIYTLLEEFKRFAQILATGIPFKNIVAPAKDYDQRLALDMVDKRINSIIAANQEISRIRVLNKDGVIVASSHSDRGENLAHDECFLNAKERIYFGKLHFSRYTGDYVINVAAPIFVNADFSGVILLNFEGESLCRITAERTGLGESGEIYLVNKDGFIITPVRFEKEAILKQKVAKEVLKDYFEVQYNHSTTHSHKVSEYRDYRGVDVLGYSVCIPEMQWLLLAEIDKSEAFAPLAQIRILFWLTAILGIALVLLLGNRISKKISAPISKLKKGVEIIGTGNLDYKVGISAKDEIGQLSRAFDKMTGDLRKSVVSINELNKEVTERKRVEQEREKLIGELTEALNKVKQLGGMLPICANCKKIRDDDGYWQQIEAYISEHADVEFSHGLCPDCVKELYPEYYDTVMKGLKNDGKS